MPNLQIFSLASGSEGNCTLLSCNGNHILIDCGISRRRMKQKLLPHEIDYQSVKAILVTHLHSDHIAHLAAVAKESHCTIYTYHRDTLLDAMNVNPDEIEVKNLPTRTFRLYDFDITPFALSHDVVCRGFKIAAEGTTFSYLTDTGCVTDKVLSVISGSDKVLIESNHDIEMLINGPYPDFLIDRVLSDEGHLSNVACAEVCEALYQSGTRFFVLGHLSRQNNTPELAYHTVYQKLSRLGEDFSLRVIGKEGFEEVL